MKKLKVLAFLFIISFYAAYANQVISPDNTLLKYYSALLTLNLNHAMDASRIIYHLSMEPSFDKNFLENELNKIQQNVEYANTNIANIILNTLDNKKQEIDKPLKNIDKHLAQVLVDIKEIRSKLKDSQSVTRDLSDIYFQINTSENDDHQEIKRILNLKTDEEPLLVVPERL
jgi:septal ring factor EnvC (AmiA/AmiB activator)